MWGDFWGHPYDISNLSFPFDAATFQSLPGVSEEMCLSGRDSHENITVIPGLFSSVELCTLVRYNHSASGNPSFQSIGIW